MTYRDIIDELRSLSRAIAIARADPGHHPIRALAEAGMALETLTHRIVEELIRQDAGAPPPPQPPVARLECDDRPSPEAGSWHGRPSLLNPPLDKKSI
jgi:hypothetical protein